MINNFKSDLVLNIAATPKDEVLKAMGYQNPTSANCERLKSVLDGPEFGLNDGGLDFKYCNEGFLRALGIIAEMDIALANHRISRIKKYLEEESDAFKPYLWIDTDFERRSEPLFVLSVSEHQRYLDFPKGFWRFSMTGNWVAPSVVFGHMSMKPVGILESGGKSSSIGFITKKTQPTY